MKSTSTRCALLDELRGLERFMSMAEQDRIAWLQGIRTAPRERHGDGSRIALYERLLPYAVIFGVTDRWVRIFGELAAQGRYRDALALIKKENPFPAVCGRICNRRCEDACTRGTVDQAVAIDAVKKFVAQPDLNAAHRTLPALHRRDFVTPGFALAGAAPHRVESHAGTAHAAAAKRQNAQACIAVQR